MSVVVPKISIITPAYNCAEYLEQCLDSVTRQGYPNVEHVVVDGASKDGTVELLQRYAEKHSHLKWISEPDRGEAEALNKAVRRATGDIIGWLNADDYYLPGSLETASQKINAAAGHHFIYGRVNLLKGRDEFHVCPDPIQHVDMPAIVRWFIGHNLFQPAMFFSRQLALDVGEWREDLMYSIDYEWWMRAVQKGYQFEFVNQIFAEARLFRDDGKTAASDLAKAKDWLATTRPFVDAMSEAEQAAYWRDYRRHYLGGYYPKGLVSPLRRKLAIGTRLRRAGILPNPKIERPSS